MSLVQECTERQHEHANSRMVFGLNTNVSGMMQTSLESRSKQRAKDQGFIANVTDYERTMCS